MRRKKMVIGALQIAGGHGANQLMSFARNLIIARLIGPEDFGLGLTFAMLVTLLEMAAELSFDKFIVQDSKGDGEDVQSTLHLFMVARGLLLAAGLFFAADLVVRILAVPQDIAWAYRVLAIAPLCAGFVHLDIKRYHRDFRYSSDVLVEVCGNLSALLTGIALALTLGDFRAMLYAVIVRFFVRMTASHLLAERKYRIGMSRQVLGRAWRFSWPLMLNGLLIFAASQGDRILIVRFLGAESLGIYGAVALVLYAIRTVVATVFRSVGLPMLASRQENRADYIAAYHRFGSIVTCAALGLGMLLFLLMPVLIPLMYGADFGIPRMLVAILVGVLVVRIFRTWANVGALALGSSRLILTSNIARTGAVVAAVAAAIVMGGDLIAVAAALLVAEAAGSCIIFLQMRVHHRLPLKYPAVYSALLGCVVVAFLCVEWLFVAAPAAAASGLYGVTCAALFAAALAALYLSSPDLRELTKLAIATTRREFGAPRASPE